MKEHKGNSGIDQNIKDINDWLNSVEFEKQLIGGVSEKDVWKKFLQLNKMYEKAFHEQKLKYEAKLKETQE